ncbi:MAG: PIN domain nuclease [Elusimicrobiota bacterium]|jgi:uncharacterized protein YacL|nr:PIN domain nuclease [Elusimicrobiota bacterium]
MPLWIFRISAILGMPFLVYIFISQDYPNIMLALLCGLIIVAAEHFVRSIKFISMMVGIFGAIAGYTIYVLCDYTVSKMNILDISNYWDAYKTMFAGVLTVLGGLISIGRVSELEGINKKGHHIKIVDMSALLDGRIVDLCETGFFEGTIVLPQFVIDKLNSLISSKDPLEKARGRRGLDTITRLKELKVIPVKTTSRNRKEGNDIENLLSITQYFNGKLITTDFNVNKAAVLKDIPILNISDLTTALKPIVLPGESMSVFIMKEGKESSQGIGYLDDGTMVVIEEGRKWIGKRTEVFVSSILQTSTGRMIFSKIKQYQD